MERLQKISQFSLVVVALGMGVYQLLYTQIMIQDPTAHIVTHLCLALMVVCLSLMVKSRSVESWLALLALLLVSVLCSVYFLVNLDAMMSFRSAIPAVPDLVVGALVVVALLVVNWIVFGRIFPVLALLGIAYLLFGPYLPQPFTVPDVGWTKLVQWVTVSFEGGLGVYGSILELSAVYLFLFIFFGGVLSAFGGTRFIIGVGRWVGSKLSGGPAMVALIGSSLLGTITGSTVANITITGSFTIPMMKNNGYSNEKAGAIEAVCSNGGQITPPVMGATAFIMAGFAGIPYIDVAIAAIVPAVVYYLCVFCFIQLTSKKEKLKSVVEPVNGRQLLMDSPVFVVPIVVLVYLMSRGYSLPFVGFWSIMSIIVLGLLSSLRKDFHLNRKEVVTEIYQSVVTASQIAVICALIGVVATSIQVSGLGIKLPLIIQDISGGHLLVALLIAMVSSIILGMGVPTAVAYMLVAIGAVPALLNMGVPRLSAHMFCFIFAAFSHITPPVAIGALVAARMAKGDYLKTNLEALKAAFVAFLLPYFIIYVPIISLNAPVSWTMGIMQAASVLIMILASQICLVGYCFESLENFERLAFFLPALLCALFLFGRNPLYFAIGAACFIMAWIWQYLTKPARQLAREAKM
jgi:TRAP transporter 4TM/12TM fusion protein